MRTVDSARDLFLEFGALGVPFRQRLPWHAEGQGAFIVEDPDGNLLLFAGRTGCAAGSTPVDEP